MQGLSSFGYMKAQKLILTSKKANLMYTDKTLKQTRKIILAAVLLEWSQPSVNRKQSSFWHQGPVPLFLMIQMH